MHQVYSFKKKFRATFISDSLHHGWGSKTPFSIIIDRCLVSLCKFALLVTCDCPASVCLPLGKRSHVTRPTDGPTVASFLRPSLPRLIRPSRGMSCVMSALPSLKDDSALERRERGRSGESDDYDDDRGWSAVSFRSTASILVAQLLGLRHRKSFPQSIIYSNYSTVPLEYKDGILYSSCHSNFLAFLNS